MLGHIGLVPAGGNYKTGHDHIARLGLDTSHFTGAAWNQGARYKNFGHTLALAEIMVENSAYNFTHGLKKASVKRRP